MNRSEYINFPIRLLWDYMKNPKNCLKNIILYHVGSLLKRGIDIESIKRELNIGEINERNRELAEYLYKNAPENSPFTGMMQETLWDYWKNTKTDFENACLLAYLAMKSIIGKSGCKKTTNIFIWSRMAGNEQAVKDVGDLPVELQRFFTRYQFDKIKLHLEDWHLSYYSNHTRGLYISFRLSKKELVKYAEDRKRTMKKRKEQHNRTTREALEAYRNNPP